MFVHQNQSNSLLNFDLKIKIHLFYYLDQTNNILILLLLFVSLILHNSVVDKTNKNRQPNNKTN